MAVRVGPICVPRARPIFPLAPQPQPQRRCTHLPKATVAHKLKLAREKHLSPAAAKLRLLKRLRCTLKFEKRAWEGGAQLVAGVDEVGRGKAAVHCCHKRHRRGGTFYHRRGSQLSTNP